MAEELIDVKICPCCGQLRPYPTRPGIWEYKQYPSMTSSEWIRCEIRISTGKEHHEAESGALLFYPYIHPLDLEGLDEEEIRDMKGPQHWPSNTMWRRVGDLIS